MSMHNPQLYEKHNEFQKRDALEHLQKLKNVIGWKPNASIVDLGCGDGSVTNDVLKKQIPEDFTELIGLDVSKEMIDYANSKYSDNKTRFYVVDLGGEVPAELKERFDHAFSSHALHFIADQIKVFRNVYDLLKDGGNFLAIMFTDSPYFKTFHQLATETKWKEYEKVAHDLLPNLFQEENWKDNFKGLLENIGFKDCAMTEHHKSFVHEKAHLKGLSQSGNFFKIDRNSPQYKEFFDDFLKCFVEINKVEMLSDDGEKLKVFYSLVIVTGRK